jgi:polygalacturonase
VYGLLAGLITSYSVVHAQTIPNAPTNLTATAVSYTQIALSWADTSSNEDGFKVERSTDGTSFTQVAQVLSNTVSYLDNGVAPGATYYYRVFSYNSAGNSDYSNAGSAVTPAPQCPLAVVGWGSGSYGQATPPVALTGVEEISAGSYHNLILMDDTTVVDWGDNSDGQTNVPPGLSSVVAVAAGGLHSLALKSDGTVVGWGSTGYGQTTPPTGLTGVVAIAAGFYHSLALKSDGTVAGWGRNNNGQTTTPSGLSGVVAIAAGYYHSLALKSDGTVVGWGYNAFGQTTTPTGLTGVVAIAAGYYHSLALKSDGTVVNWGANFFGQTTAPTGLNTIVAIAAGAYHNLALKSDGTVVGWGYNTSGQATPPGGLSGVTAIAAGYSHSLGLAVRPGLPSGLTATAVGVNEVDLSWNGNSSGVTGYEIDRAPDASNSPGIWTQIATVGSNVTTYADTNVVTGVIYWYRVRADNACAESDYDTVRVPVVLLDDTWSTGVRTSQNLPASSAWWGSCSDCLTSSPGNMTFAVVTNSSVMAITYFTPDSNSPPVTLNVGDTLTATLTFLFNGVPTPGSTSQGFRIGLFDFADGSNVPSRVSSDGFSAGGEGSYVQGYALFGKTYASFSDATPIDIRKRIAVSDGSLLGSSGDWSSLVKDTLNTNAFGGFANLTPYSLQFVLQRTGLNSLAITVTWSNMTSGATLSDSTTDSSASGFSFDAIAFRPQNNTQAPTTNQFNEVKIVVTSAPVAPSIITQPQSQLVSSTQTAPFSVVPNGTLPLFYQWYYNTNTPLANATNSTFTITNVGLADAGGYSVLISNSYGAVTSTVAALTITNAAPAISAQPQSLTVIPGQNASFSVGANGSAPLGYQWYYNITTPLAGATGATLTLTNVQPGDAGSYSVVVTNPVGSVTSPNAILSVNTNPVAPLFLTQPVSLGVYVGNNASFSATAIGTAPISYQWAKNSVAISGATASSLILTNVQLTDAGSYTVIAANGIGSTTSSVATLSVTLRTPPPLPVIPTNQFSVLNFGAVGDGVFNNATAIQNTIKAAAAAGGGTVEILSAGSLSTYLSGPIVLTNNVNLQIDSGAMLQMLPRSNWPGTSAFINGSGLHDVEISGSGTIDGQGTNWWFPLASSRPNFINLSGCTRVLIQGVTLQNPPTFHMMLKGKNAGLTIQNLTINTPGDSPNTDGMDLASTNVLVQNCFISDGDDNIEIGGSDPTADITISNCTFGTGHGVSIGSYTSGGVHDLLVSNCTFNGTDNGIRMKSDQDRGGLVQNLQYLDISMTNVGYPITIYSYYNYVGTPNSISPAIAAANGAQPVINTTPIWQNIVISNLTATAQTGKNIAGIIWGRPEMPVSNILLCKVNIVAPTNTFAIYSSRGIQIIDSNLTAPNSSTNTLTLYNAQITITNNAANANLVTLGGMVVPLTNNVVAFFNTQAAIPDATMLGSNPYLTLGNSTLTVGNDLILGPGSTLNFGLGTNVAEIAVTHNLVAGGTLNVTDAGGLANGTYTLFTYGGVLTGNGIGIGSTPAGHHYAIDTNTLGQMNLAVSPLLTPLQQWQVQYFGSTNNAAADPNADADGDGQRNLAEFLAGTDPTNSASVIRIIGVTREGQDVRVTWTTSNGKTNALQFTTGNVNGGYATNNFTDLFIVTNTVGGVTNYLDVGGVTNFPARFYRVRLVP